MSMILLWKTMRLLSHNLPQEMTQRVLLPFTINITRQVCNYMCTELNIISCNYVWGNVGQWLSYVFLIIWCDPLAKHLHWWWEISRVSWFIMIHVPQIFHVGMPLESPKKKHVAIAGAEQCWSCWPWDPVDFRTWNHHDGRPTRSSLENLRRSH